MKLPIQHISNFSFVESNPGKENLLLLHGLFGSLSNFNSIIEGLGQSYNVCIPILPIYEIPTDVDSLDFLLDYVTKFIQVKSFKSFSILGNSLGGHLAQMYTLQNPMQVNSLILTGSSGLFETGGLGNNTFLKRGDYEFIKMKTEGTFYDANTATKEMVDEVFECINDRQKAIRLILTAKSAMRHNLENKLSGLHNRTLLVWGLQDEITPPFVAEKFNELLPNSELVFIDKCGHAPMMEHPLKFNEALLKFLQSRVSVCN